MGKIITVTLNPTIDKSTVVDEIVPDQKIRCEKPKYEPGGGGINVSRALKKLGGESIATFLAGGHIGNFFIELLQKENSSNKPFFIKDQTRENLILFDKSTNNQYRFGMEGPDVTEDEWKGFLNTIEKINDIDYIVGSGSLSPGVPVDFYARLGKIAKDKKAKYILDTSGEALSHALSEGVFLFKPNLGELASLTGLKDLNKQMVEEKALEILHSQNCEAIVVSLGPDGALLVSKNITEHIPSPKVERKSTVGAGDSMVAGMVFILSQNKTLQEAARYGVACGTAATMNPGTELCKKEDVENLYKWINEQ